MTTISCETVLRSRNLSKPDKVLSCFKWRYPRWIHAEGRTHRLLEIEEGFDFEPRTPSPMEDENLSRNASSSRAIPVSKLIQDVLDDPAVPLFWGKNQKGMQGNEEHDSMIVSPYAIEPEDETLNREAAWISAMHDAIDWAKAFDESGYHKQIINRLLEPFSHITVVVSGTEWSNFLALRDHPDAEPHIRMLAQATRRELERGDNIQNLEPGDWHLPFVSEEDRLATVQWLGLNHKPIELAPEYNRTLSVARCASTSYKTVDGFNMTLERAFSLHDKLVGSHPIHASPCEHVAQADKWGHHGDMVSSGVQRQRYESWERKSQHGNFVGFRQYRKMLPKECL